MTNEEDDQTLAEIIHAKLNAEEKFALKAKMDLNGFSKSFGKEDLEKEYTFLTDDHVECFFKSHKNLDELKLEMDSVLISIERLQNALLSFSENDDEYIRIYLKKENAFLLESKKLGITYAIAPRVEEKEEDYDD